MRNTATDNYKELLNELNQGKGFKRQERTPYSASMIWYVLHLCYASLLAYRLLLEKSPLLSLSLLNNIQQGGVDALKVLKSFYEKSPFLMNYICKNLHRINKGSISVGP